ncbi:MAG: methyltransferase domain-containing protein [Bacteroidota bacterium]
MKKLLRQVLVCRARQLHQQFAPFLPEAGKFLDIGSGTGYTGDEILRQTALELHEVDVADRSRVDRTPVLFDGRHLPYSADHFAVASAIDTLQYAPSPEHLIRESLRVSEMLLLVSAVPPRGWRRLPAWAQDILGGRRSRSVLRRLGIGQPDRPNRSKAREYSVAEVEAAVQAVGGRLVKHEPKNQRSRSHLFVIVRADAKEKTKQPAASVRTRYRTGQSRYSFSHLRAARGAQRVAFSGRG